MLGASVRAADACITASYACNARTDRLKHCIVMLRLHAQLQQSIGKPQALLFTDSNMAEEVIELMMLECTIDC